MVDKKKLLETLEIYGEAVLTAAIENLRRAGKGGGALEKSLKKRVYEFGIEILALEYAYWVDKGRKPNRKQPPTDAIRGWIRSSGLPIPEKAAFAIARNIGRFGIAPSRFLSDAIQKTQVGLRRELKRTVRQLIEESIK